jgi:hypothetical protein
VIAISHKKWGHIADITEKIAGEYFLIGAWRSLALLEWDKFGEIIGSLSTFVYKVCVLRGIGGTYPRKSMFNLSS